jgi:hypothetical protein
MDFLYLDNLAQRRLANPKGGLVRQLVVFFLGHHSQKTWRKSGKISLSEKQK